MALPKKKNKKKQINAWPGGMSTKTGHLYVGGRTTWEALKKAYPKTLIPFRRSGRGDEYYQKATIDLVLDLAEANGDLLASKP